MSAKWFLDTNIFVYSFDHSSPKKRTRAQSLIDESVRSGNGVISYQVIQEFLNVSAMKFAVPLQVNEAQVYLSMVLRPLCAVASSMALFDSALLLKERFKFAFYDALIIAAALQSDCRRLYSEDFQHGQIISNLTIENPFLD